MAFWDKIQSSGDVEDRRGNSVVTGVGSIGAVIVVGILMFAGGADSSQIQKFLVDSLQSGQSTSQGEFVDTNNYKGFAQKIIGSNNDIWSSELANNGIEYQKPKLVLFRGATESGCGGADSQVGPHYCPADKTIYLDETFFEELKSRFGAKGGDVAESYVMAHEVGHHIQNISGSFSKTSRGNRRNNQDSVKVELQADCYAGLWAGNVESIGIISESEISQAIDAASAVGDDRIQKATTGVINPETWTHGSSEQRKQAFLKGYQTKDMTQCEF